MDTRSGKRFGTGFMLATAGLVFAVLAGAQETLPDDREELEPAVDTSAAIEPAVDTSAGLAAPQAGAEDSPEPAPQVAADVTRQQTGSGVMDRLELGRTEITGNQELPKVLYIVPWRKSDPGQLMGRPVNTLLDEVLAPLDREEFIRQVDYYEDLYGDGE